MHIFSDIYKNTFETSSIVDTCDEERRFCIIMDQSSAYFDISGWIHF
jgi:hypothetical protein